MIIYVVCESVSGETREVKANNPTQAVIKFLKEDEKIDTKKDYWGSCSWDFEVERKYKRVVKFEKEH